MRAMRWAVLAAVILVSSGCVARAPGADATGQYLREHPELVLEVLREHPVEVLEIVEEGSQQRRALAQRLHMDDRLADPLRPVIDPARAHAGPDDAPLTIVVYSNLLCSHCAQADQRLHDFMRAHPGEAQVYLKHFTDGALSRSLAQIYEAISLQSTSKALMFQEMVFEDRDKLAEGDYSILKQILDALELDVDRLGQDQDSQVVADRLAADEAEALNFGFTGTPVVVVNGLDFAGAPTVAELEWLADLAGVNLDSGQ